MNHYLMNLARRGAGIDPRRDAPAGGSIRPGHGSMGLHGPRTAAPAPEASQPEVGMEASGAFEFRSEERPAVERTVPPCAPTDVVPRPFAMLDAPSTLDQEKIFSPLLEAVEMSGPEVENRPAGRGLAKSREVEFSPRARPRPSAMPGVLPPGSQWDARHYPDEGSSPRDFRVDRRPWPEPSPTANDPGNRFEAAAIGLREDGVQIQTRGDKSLSADMGKGIVPAPRSSGLARHASLQTDAAFPSTGRQLAGDVVAGKPVEVADVSPATRAVPGPEMDRLMAVRFPQTRTVSEKHRPDPARHPMPPIRPSADSLSNLVATTASTPRNVRSKGAGRDTEARRPVQVLIGRVEVRAVQEGGKAPPPSSPATPRGGFDDYFSLRTYIYPEP